MTLNETLLLLRFVDQKIYFSLKKIYSTGKSASGRAIGGSGPA